MFSSNRPGPSSESPRSGSAVAEIEDIVPAVDQPNARAHVALVTSSPGAAVLVWGPEAVCLAYNRHYRVLAGLRWNALGKPLFKVHPELEKTWRPKLDLALNGTGVPVDGSAFPSGTDGHAGDNEVGWLLPAAGADGLPKGAIALFRDVRPALEPLRRLLGAVGHDLRDPLVGIRVVSERLERAPKLTRERCASDMHRVLELTSQLEQLSDDMSTYARLVGASGALRIAPRPCDLAKVVRSACAELAPNREPPIRVTSAEALGSWDDDAIRRIVHALLGSSLRSSPEGGTVVVEVGPTREGAAISVRDDGPSVREDDLDQVFEPWKRGGSPAAEKRRAGAGLGLFLARELAVAHGGRIALDRPTQGGFVLRVSLPGATQPTTGSFPPVSLQGSGGGSGLYRAISTDRRPPDSGSRT